MVDHHVLADLGGFSDDRPHAVVYEEPAADAGTWVDFDPGQEPGRLRDYPWHQRDIPLPQFMCDAV